MRKLRSTRLKISMQIFSAVGTWSRKRVDINIQIFMIERLNHFSRFRRTHRGPVRFAIIPVAGIHRPLRYSDFDLERNCGRAHTDCCTFRRRAWFFPLHQAARWCRRCEAAKSVAPRPGGCFISIIPASVPSRPPLPFCLPKQSTNRSGVCRTGAPDVIPHA